MKFFLFRREHINEASVKSSDSGIGLSVFAVSVSQMAFMSAAKGSINITFNSAGVYEHTSLLAGESFEKTSVSISCIVGQELNLMEDILDFVTSTDPNKLVMRFDVVTGKSTFEKAIANSVSDIFTTVKINPIVMSSGEISKGDSQKKFLDTIADIYFGADKPSLDFNHEGLSSYSNSAEITAWANAGTKGSLHSIVANEGSPSCQLTFETSGIGKASATLNSNDYFTVPNAFVTTGAYTLYMALKPSSGGNGMGVIYGDADGDTMGMCFGDVVYDVDNHIEKANPALSLFKVRHDGRSGEPASVSTATTEKTASKTEVKEYPTKTVSTVLKTPSEVKEEGGTIKYSFPENYFNPDGETCHVFVVRRDDKHNMYLHNSSGELVAFIPSFTVADTAGGNNTSMSGMTDGNLLIEQVGSGGGVTSGGSSQSFKGSLARFGVIEKDIGTSKAAELARNLFSLYNL